ncbi:flagellar filament capping protein FliD, partial [Coprococcus sp. MSK.21.13]|nr:flagellar filament capping protein FliD [Coprococcus sp. MSK.21.13]
IDGNYTVKVEQLATGARATAALGNDTTKSTQLSVVAEQLKNIGIENYKDGFEIKVAGKTFKVNGLSDDSTVEDLVNAIKNASDEDDSKEKLSNYVDVSFSEITKEFIIETKETGKDQTIEIGGKNATEAGSIKKGQDAKISVVTPKSEKNEDGTYKSYEITNAKNNFTLDGITFNLKGISKEGETANLNVTKDVDKTFDRFKEFIDKYNSLVGNIKGKLTEKKAYSYKPLTEEQ